MPSFTTHFVAAGTLGLIGAWLGRVKLSWDWSVVVTAWLIGLAGGLVPDLDAPQGRPVRLVISILGLVLAIGAGQWLLKNNRTFGTVWTPERVVMICAGIMFLVYTTGPRILTALTDHRGMCHSLPAALAYTAGVVWVFSAAGRGPALWLGAIGLAGIGSHLLLDAAGSLSFHPLKLWSKDWLATALTWSLAIVLIVLAGRRWY